MDKHTGSMNTNPVHILVLLSDVNNADVRTGYNATTFFTILMEEIWYCLCY